VCYSHTPMRWVWRTEDYLARENHRGLKQLLLRWPLKWLKAWELRAAMRPDLYIANSTIVADRLWRAFGVRAAVIPPPIETARFAPASGTDGPPPEDFYLAISRLVPYKRLDLAVEACTKTGRRLIVIGDGPDRPRLQELAGPTVTFLGRVPDEVVVSHARRCRALLFPGEEDFGITPLEVNAAGRPVVAFNGGGATETIIEGLNGTFFHESSVQALVPALGRCEATTWDSKLIRQHARKYDVHVFRNRILAFLRDAIAKRNLGSAHLAGLQRAS
jgi:glycosyltransferase involved in cell wall biosynthesis